jgi:hypothetical protein
MATSVDTSKVKRRDLNFESVDDALAELGRIMEADQAGRLRTLGNWTPGQVMGHVAAWIDYGFDGYPIDPPPWFVRWILRMRLKKYLHGKLPAGVRIPRIENGTVGTEPYSTVEGGERLRRALQRFQRGEPAKYDSPAFGPMSPEDRVQLNLRHAELHLGFLTYDAQG